ncbi:MAG: DUF4364 domain-containing protein [Thermoplasmata archaeon]|nr:DUF4364 domain-containing protein [Thermoplasmata archaeon]
MINGRRSDIDIIGGILEVVGEGAKKTEIVYKVNLNHSLLKRYLSVLVEKKLISENHLGNTKIYSITDKGMKLLDAIKKVKDYLG